MNALAEQDLLMLGEFGYCSNEKFDLTREKTENAFALGLRLVSLEQPIVKKAMNEAEDIRRYAKLAASGNAAGVYVDGGLVALAVTEPQTWNNTLMIWHFQVHGDHRRKGYGEALLRYVCRRAAEKGFRAVTLETQNTNVPAIRFYLRCGFEIEGIDASFYSNNESGEEEVALFIEMREKEKL